MKNTQIWQQIRKKTKLDDIAVKHMSCLYSDEKVNFHYRKETSNISMLI